MNPLVILAVLYGLITLGSASILYFSFKGRVDTSGRYFLLAEILTLFLLAQVMLVNINPDLISPYTLFAQNVIHTSSEIAVLFSIYSLTRKIHFKQYLMSVFVGVLYYLFLEVCRVLDPKSSVLLYGISTTGIALTTYAILKSTKNDELNNNLFLRWIGYTEICLTCFGVLRIISYFSDTPLVPRYPTTQTVFFHIFLVVIGVFRYFSYQSLRISWVDDSSMKHNQLNQNLVKLVREKNQFLEGLISSNRALGISALANSLAHQLSQPITGVILQTEVVKRDLKDLGNHQTSVETLNAVTEQLSKLSTLVNNLRKLFGAQESTYMSFNLREACNEVLDVITPTLEAKSIALTKLYENNPTAFGNPVHIQQVLINIFNNAIDSIESSHKQLKKINLIVSEYETFAVISIQDTGSGIATHIAPTIFELYKSTKKEGLGIGLWLSKTIIDKHNGYITAINNPQGGAIVEIRIPLANQFRGN